MYQSHLLWRLYSGYVIIILLSTLTVGYTLSRQFSDNNLEEIERSLVVRSELLSELVRPVLTSGFGFEQLQNSISKLGSSTESRITIITLDGRVIADSEESTQAMDNHLQRPEIVEAADSGRGTTSRYSDTLQQQMMYLALAVRDEQENIGFVRVSLPLTSVDESLAQMRVPILVSALLVACVALLIGFFFAKRFSDPIIHITEAAEAISRGDYNRRIDLDQKDEVGGLAKAFNRMARISTERMDEITLDHNRLKKLIAGMVEGVIDVDEDQRIAHINEVACRILSISIEQCIGEPVWEHVSAVEIISALEEANVSRVVVNTQMTRATPEGDEVVDIYVTALHNDNGDSIGALIVLNDISELDYLGTIRRDFVANASHELKTPITAIRGLTETILDDPDMDASVQKDFVEKAHVQSLRLSSLISDLMTISRLESDRQDQNFQVFDLRTIVKSSETAMKIICQEKELELHVELPEKEVRINGDFQAISQLTDNLTDNAIKYTNSGGTVSLKLECQDQMAVLTVTDTGIGISLQHQQRIFERFYRVDKARSRELGGTGLGLSIVKNIAEQHGGSISVSSKSGKGSSFVLRLPLENFVA